MTTTLPHWKRAAAHYALLLSLRYDLPLARSAGA